MKHLLVIVAVLVVSLASGCALVKKQPERERKRVVLISIDGLRPEFYLSQDFQAPTLKRMAAEGIASEGMLPVFPSLTYPNHVTMVTGVEPARHGVVANAQFNRETGEVGEWYFESSHIKVPTVWDKAKAAGLSVALMQWPAALGALVDWQLPEVFSKSDGLQGSWELVKKHTRSEFLARLETLYATEGGLAAPKNMADVDELVTRATVMVLRENSPQLTMVHLISLDEAQHRTGRSSNETKVALKNIDQLVSRIMAAANLNETSVIVVGDHGFMNYHTNLHVNVLFKKRGWDKRHKLYAHVHGGQAAVYLGDPHMGGKVLKVLRSNARGRYRVIERSKLNELGAYPDAFCALDAEEGYSFAPGNVGAMTEPLKGEVKGVHGGLGSHSELHSGFLALGAGIDSASKLKRMPIQNVNAMLLKILALPTN